MTQRFSLLCTSLALTLSTSAAEAPESTPDGLEPEVNLLPTLSTHVEFPHRPTEHLRPDQTPLNATPAATTGEGWQRFAHEFTSTFKFGGYIIGKYNYSDQEGTKSNGGFDIRLMRLYANGYAWRNVYYRFQMEVNDAPGIDRGPRVVDAFVEWQELPYLKVKLGQFKRCFGFENPMSPLDIGLGSFSQIASKLQSINDRIGEHPSSGRDVGVQVQGDFLPIAADRHPFVHYQVGLYNGQGVNHKDINKHKDLIAGVWLSPIKTLNIGAFGWNGRFTSETTGQNINRHRYGVGVKYEADWTVRAEYVHSVGTTLAGGPDRSDGWYTTLGVPVQGVKGLKIYGRWDCYRDDARTWNSLKTNWGLTGNYWMAQNLLLQLNLTHTYDRSLATGKDKHYNVVDVQVAARF